MEFTTEAQRAQRRNFVGVLFTYCLSLCPSVALCLCGEAIARNRHQTLVLEGVLEEY